MITLQEVRKSFGRIRAVDGLTLEVTRGECLGLLGPNGAGKSTTIAMMVGLTKPDSGSVKVGGGQWAGDPGTASVRARIGFAPQSLALYDELSAEENLRFFGAVWGLTGSVLAQRVGEALEFVALVDRRHDRVVGFSGGMKRRLNLAAAVLHRPEVVLMDEPTAGVDPQSRNAIFGIVELLIRQGTTVVYSTHYMEEAERICDRVAIVDRGRLLALDTVPALKAAYGGASIVTIKRFGAELAERVVTLEPVQAIAAAVNAGAVESASVQSPNLESVFLKLTGRSLRD